ncbi:nitrilase-related carbon-nitrogen hydrolase [Nocardia sp. NPDC088792]|uniref:nitrilase-related carbon-nitrogen hydrolase n=1 Tax=Nocardia sp. NPDC088792 TaxID=3364332 RepID=UPI003820C695
MGYVHEQVGAVAATVSSGVLFYFGTGLTPVAALTWLAPLPVLLLATRAHARTALPAAFLAYLGGTANIWAWSLRSHDLPLLPWGLVVSVCLSATFVLAVALFRRLVLLGHAWLGALAASAVWTGVLYLVTLLNPKGLTDTFATAQADVPVVVQTVSITGSWGLEFLVLLVPAAAAAVLAPTVRRVARIRTGAFILGVTALVLIGGVIRLTSEPIAPQRMAVVSANMHGWAADVGTPAGKALVDSYVHRIAALPSGVRTIVLPEGTFGATEPSPPVLVDRFRALARDRQAVLVVGYAQWAKNAKYNYALVFPADGSAPLRYLKHHDAVSPPGHDLVVHDDTGVEICLDVNFAEPSRDYATAGATRLAVPASDEGDDGWLHSRTALLRGAENGLPVVWGGRQTRQMISDGWGRVVADVPSGVDPSGFTTLVAEVGSGPGPTWYTRLGDWFAWLCLVVSAAGMAVAVRVRR